ncbi:hypothetical protein [Archangium sp.]|uniref:hypothetical protein n=1 Tax=Archangium sp. TaxID=1872627 RepID=UPI00286BFBE2|nr:hypothetical protein [Archangium sp.]
MKISFGTVAALVVGATLSFSAVAYTSNTEPSSAPPQGPTQESGCYDRPDGFTCCSCGSGKVCCVKIGELLPNVPG